VESKAFLGLLKSRLRPSAVDVPRFDTPTAISPLTGLRLVSGGVSSSRVRRNSTTWLSAPGGPLVS